MGTAALFEQKSEVQFFFQPIVTELLDQCLLEVLTSLTF